MAERHSRILAELSEAGLVAVRNLQGRMQTTENDQAAATLAMALHRISRSVRQTLALEAKLERDRHRQDAEDRAEAAREADGLRRDRRTQVRIAVERLIWTEADREDDEGLEAEAALRIERLEDLLDLAALSPDFLESSVETHIARIRQDLGITTDDDPPVPPP